jgi:uncharacterized protein (TIGR03067 family)
MRFKHCAAAIAAMVLLVALADVGLAKEPNADSILGTWVVESAMRDGKPDNEPVGDSVEYAGGTMTIKEANKKRDPTSMNYTLDTSQSPWHIDITPVEKERKFHVMGVIGLDGGKLKLCLRKPGKGRPTGFDSEKGTDDISIVLKRADK